MTRALSVVATALLATAVFVMLMWVIAGGISGYIDDFMDSVANTRSQLSSSDRSD
jgi:hypothetical protein